MRALILIEDGPGGMVNVTAAYTCKPGWERHSPAGKAATDAVAWLADRMEPVSREEPNPDANDR